MDRFAVISDVHGNRWALEAVLEDIAAAGVADVVDLGDTLYGPLDPRGTAELLMARGFPTVRGNEDHEITDDVAEVSATLAFTRDQLAPAHLDWLRALPARLVLDDILLCHGTPDSDTTYLLWTVARSGARLRTPAESAALIPRTDCTLILCGHDHVPGRLDLPDGRLVVDPGSVGLPAYDDDAPHPHVMQAGTPHARYAIVSRDGAGWRAEHRAVAYDWEAAAVAAAAHGRPDWARWLLMGQA